MKNFVKYPLAAGLVLLGACLTVGGQALAKTVGKIDMKHAIDEMDEEEADEPSGRQLAQLGLKDAKLKKVRAGIWAVTQGGKKAGHVVASSYFAKDVTGFKGATPLLIYIDRGKIIRHIYALPNNDTASFFTRATSLLKQWIGKSATAGAKLKVDAVTGATYSSRGVTGNMKAALEAYNRYVK